MSEVVVVTGQLLYDTGFWYLIAPSGVFHILLEDIPKNPREGEEITLRCEVLPGYGNVDGRSQAY